MVTIFGDDAAVLQVGRIEAATVPLKPTRSSILIPAGATHQLVKISACPALIHCKRLNPLLSPR